MQIIFLILIFFSSISTSIAKDMLILSSVGGVYNINNHFKDLKKNVIDTLQYSQIIKNIDKSKYEVVCVNYYSKIFGTMSHKNCDKIIEYNSNIIDFGFLTIDSFIDYDIHEWLTLNKITNYFYITRPLLLEKSVSNIIKKSNFNNYIIISNNIHMEHLIFKKLVRKFSNKKIMIKIKDYNLDKIIKKSKDPNLFISDYELNSVLAASKFEKTVDFDFVTILSENNYDELTKYKEVSWDNILNKNKKIKELYLNSLK
jgi:hypothetical protein